MRVGFDHEAFLIAQGGGITRYFVEMIRAAAQSSAFRPLVVAPLYASGQLHEIRSFVQVKGIYCPLLPDRRGRGWLGKNLARLTYRTLRGAQAEVVHATWFGSPLLFDGPVVLTVHDLIPEEMASPADFRNSGYLRSRREGLQRAAAVICPSEATASAIQKHYPEIDVSVSVIPHGCHLLPALDGVRSRPRPYLLHVGRRSGYKNFAVLRDTWHSIARRFPDLELVCVGGGDLAPEDVAGLDASGLARIHHCRHASDEELSALYAGAAAVVCPSLLEGFGLPVIEAMAAGAPVVCARASCLPEVAGDAAAYFNPAEPSDLESAIAAVVGEPSVATALRERGWLRAQSFTWERSAWAHREVYESVLLAKLRDRHDRTARTRMQ